MRTIKFRAWSNDYKKMFYTEHSENLDLLPIWIRCPNDYGLMQFTGLKDKNGKEIYEGDIVKWGNGKDAVNEVIYSGDRFMLYNLGAPSLARVSIDSEIIGNIYENPELISDRS